MSSSHLCITKISDKIPPKIKIELDEKPSEIVTKIPSPIEKDQSSDGKMELPDKYGYWYTGN